MRQCCYPFLYMKGQYAQQNILRNDVHDPPTGKGKAVHRHRTNPFYTAHRCTVRIFIALDVYPGCCSALLHHPGSRAVYRGERQKHYEWAARSPQGEQMGNLVDERAAAGLGAFGCRRSGCAARERISHDMGNGYHGLCAYFYHRLRSVGIKWLILGGGKGSDNLAALLIVISAVTAIRVLSSPGDLAAGLAPSIPDDFEMTFVMPWVGFFLAGASGILWYSYWVGDKEFGGTPNDRSETVEVNEEVDDDRKKLAKVTLWMRSLGLTSGIGILLGTLVNVAFMILGAELLASEDDLPEGADVVEKLTQSLEGVWGPAGYWAFLVCVAIALGSSILANQDGGGRMFSDAARLLFQRPNNYLSNRNNVSKFFIVTVGMVIPLLIYIIERDPVKILSLAGIISAIQIPVIVFFTFYLNKKLLPKICQPGALSSGILLCAGLFYSALAIIQVVDFF
ncbi:hypothetical protein SAMN05421747_11565 [Parapedobacter composti]|uniref:Mn2+ and Fe2+ transporters of the NRAMP family n=2 Tax=Parapedobacter composti TaxID=623281 RepID=A0A1I1KI73_9SPHI|nr:hypothetical protein SAMN05421747_11565 [Parapedobacter composti]